MPEGDTIHKLAGVLGPELSGREVARLWLKHARTELRPGPVSGVDALGKHLFIRFENGTALRTHLGLYGGWHRYAHGEPWVKPGQRAAVILETTRAVYVCFTPLEVELVRNAGVGERELEKYLGPDLVADESDYDAIVAAARSRLETDTLLMDVLLDQRIACGIGNIYKSELLFLAGLSPTITLGETDDATLAAIYREASRLLRRNIGQGPRITRHVEDGRGRLWVYGRRQAPCFHCETPIQRQRLGRHLRVTFWCPHCQAGTRP